jgi:hypothetical protein
MLQICFRTEATRTCKVNRNQPCHVCIFLQDVARNGVRETVHVLITTYTEPAVTVRECVLRLLVAPEPLYMEKVIYVCDDGYGKAEGPKKREMVEELRTLGASLPEICHAGKAVECVL